MRDIPKRIRRQLRELCEQAYENELRRELEQLAQRFQAWRQDEITSDELNFSIHQFHQGAARDLYLFYNCRGNEDIAVAAAIRRGILEPNAVPDEVRRCIEPLLQMETPQGDAI